MFDRHIHNHEVAPAYAQTVTKHEHRAPTDQSVALLREMEQAAQDRLVARVSVQSTEFACEAHVFDVPSDLWNSHLRIRFKLGDKSHDITEVIPTDMVHNKLELWQKIREIVAKRIADEILRGSISELVKHRSLRP